MGSHYEALHTMVRDWNSLLKIKARAALFLFANVLTFLFLAHALCAPCAAQDQADKPPNAVAASVSRPCSLPGVDPKHKDKPKTKAASRSQPASACLEAMGSPVDLLEFFQAFVREQRWGIDDERIAEDTWIFSRYLDKDELLQFAKEGLLAGRVQWTGGKALVAITAHEVKGGFTRVEVSARFQGGGQSVDRFAPPRDTWDLDSTGALEKILIAALETHLKSIH
ncbi:MAG TPA: hypothetical protein VE263_07000 [Candidatus Angelobacter sp.]|nr:hypothetical protein [Candidatus Angelobacter sp.]